MQEPKTDKKKLNVPEKHLPIKPLSKKELQEVARERVELISEEFTKGFKFLEDYPRSVTFFGSARFTEDNPYYELARNIAGKIVKELHYSVLSGGGPGIMEAANRGAFENGGESLGLTVDLPEGQAVNPYINHHIDFFYFFSRKVCMSYSAEAYLFFPGGFGTFDEVYEILTLVQTHKIEKVPIILVGEKFWKPIEQTLHKSMLDLGMIDEQDMALYTMTDDVDTIIDIIRKAPIENGVPLPTYIPKNHTQEHELAKKKCVPCEGGTTPLEKEKSEKLLEQVNRWILVEDKSLEKTLVMKDFSEVMRFVGRVAKIAEEENHHPDIHIFDYNKVKITLSTHAISGLSENDFIMAAKIDEVLR